MNAALKAFQEQQQPPRRDPSSSTAAAASKTPSDSSSMATLQTIATKEAVRIVAEVPIGCLTFDSFASIIDQGRLTAITEDDNLHFLCIVNEYQHRCDSEGKYLLAEDCLRCLVCLEKEKENRVVGKIKSALAYDLTKIVTAHEKQLEEFIQNWDEYLRRFEKKSQQSLADLQKNHEEQMEDLHQSLSRDIENKPKKWSSELLYCRKSLENVAEQKLYREATMIKQVTDALEEEEEANMNAKRFRNMSAKVRNLEKRQKADVAALMKRIETKRRETTKKREEDTARLVQRNRSIVKMLESKNKLECSRVALDTQQRIKRVLNQR